MAKWNGTKVAVKILDKDSSSDPDSMYVLILLNSYKCAISINVSFGISSNVNVVMTEHRILYCKADLCLMMTDKSFCGDLSKIYVFSKVDYVVALVNSVGFGSHISFGLNCPLEFTIQLLLQNRCHFTSNAYSLSDRNAFKNELTLLEKVRHPNVVQFVGAVTQNMPMMIVLEYHPKVSTHKQSVSLSIHTYT